MLFLKGKYMGFLLLLILVVYLLTRGGNNKDVVNDDSLSQRNQEWIDFIAGYRSVAKTDSEKALIRRMLADVEAQGISDKKFSEPFLYPEDTISETAEPVELTENRVAAATVSPAGSEETPAFARDIQLDNASLLLYFGAFLFVASIGLFIAFGATSGGLRTLAVGLVMGVLYCGGIWLFHNRPKLKQAGLAFTGMGMAIAPLVGVAAYYYLFEQNNGSLVWLLTSLMCAVMYFHALVVLRSSLVSYMLIFTFLSLFESGVSIIDAPVYYFGWAMAFVGIVLTIISRIKGYWPELQESSHTSSQLFLPLAIFASLALVSEHGVGQLGVSLLFAAVYYGLQAFSSAGTEQETNAATAQVAALGGITALTYATSESWRTIAITLLLINILQLMAIIYAPAQNRLWRNFASIMMLAGGFAALAALMSPGVLVTTVAALLVTGIVVWWRQQRTDAYAVASLAWTALPFLVGQVLIEPGVSASTQALWSFMALLLKQGFYLWEKPRTKLDHWTGAAQQGILIGAASVLITAFLAPAWMCFVVCLGLAISLIALAELDQENDWAVAGGLVAALPLLVVWDMPIVALTATLAALLLNIATTLRHKHELNRWFSTILWLIVPLSLANEVFSIEWTAAYYAWTYLLVMIGLIVSRAIARGVILVSSTAALASYARTASLSYVYGYVTAAVIAVLSAFASTDSQLHATLILTILTLTTIVLSIYIEKRSDIMAAVPLLLQAILWSAVRPTVGGTMVPYLFASTITALVSYALSIEVAGSKYKKEIIDAVRQGAIVAVFVAPFSYFFVGETLWPMPFGLFCAGLLLYYHIKTTSQANRELAGGLMVAALMWFMYWAGVRNLQAYTHVLAAFFAAYAYWRHRRGEIEQSDQYLMTMLATATIPLALQAISGVAGGLYGWWLLLEQIGFMLLGMTINKRFVTQWGLYVAVGAVLYQLRNLGWAALTVLAVFIIGIAMYQLQKHTDKE